MVSWREVHAGASDRLAAVGVPNSEAEARWMVECASGYERGEYLAGLDAEATQRTLAAFDRMLERRLGGEPLQYVLGSWSFRSLDLMVDRRVLIPRPETEFLVDVALDVLDATTARHGTAVVVDLGTGSGAIALALAAERRDVEVWATDVSVDALDVTRANLAGIGRAATRVRLAEGAWFAALPAELRGRVALVVSNPPYISVGETLPAGVAEWEPSGALLSGPTGLEDLTQIIAAAPAWLAPGGALVVEHAPHQEADVLALAREAGLVDAAVLADLAGRPRALRAFSSMASSPA